MSRGYALSLLLAIALTGQTPDGASVYAQHCARCHESDKTGWALERKALAKLPPEAILGTLHVGLMSMMATLTDAEKTAVASWLVGKPMDPFRMPQPP